MASETQRIRQTASPSSKKHHHTSKSSQSNNPSQADGYYGHEDTAKMAAAFITFLFACPDLPPPSTNLTASGQPAPSPKLAHFVAYALHRTRLAPSVTFAALYLLQRLKTRFPAARGSSGHRLFISAFMIASKIVCDDTYSNKSWAVVGQHMFSLREINQMEREMCGYLEWHLNVGGSELESFSDEIAVKFASPSFQATYFRTKPTKPVINGAAAPSSSSSACSAILTAAMPAFSKLGGSLSAPAAVAASSKATVSDGSSKEAVYPSPTVVSTHMDEDEEIANGENNGVVGGGDSAEHEAALLAAGAIDGISPASRSMASSSPESDMVSTPTSAHGVEDDSTQIVSLEPLIRTQHPHHHHQVVTAAGAASSSASKTGGALPPAVRMDANGRSMRAGEAVW